MFENPLATTTSSLGLHPSHTLPEKIQAAASAQFSAIEVIYQELEDYALSQIGLRYHTRSLLSARSASLDYDPRWACMGGLDGLSHQKA